MRPHIILQSLLYLSIAVFVECTPYFLLTNTRPKCLTVEGPRNTALTITYQAPDMVMLPEDDSEIVNQQKEQGGLDERFNKRYQEKMIAMQKAGRKMVDISIVAYQKGETVTSTREWKLPGAVGSGRLRRELTERQGTVEYITGARDAPVEICIQSMAANPKNPSRVALSVTQQVKVNKQKQKEKQEQQAQVHMSALEVELVQLDKKADMILTNADYAKEQEASFHEQSLAMNRASQYWPMIHLGVLLVTGFTQANHIIRFFKSHHIY